MNELNPGARIEVETCHCRRKLHGLRGTVIGPHSYLEGWLIVSLDGSSETDQMRRQDLIVRRSVKHETTDAPIDLGQ